MTTQPPAACPQCAHDLDIHTTYILDTSRHLGMRLCPITACACGTTLSAARATPADTADTLRAIITTAGLPLPDFLMVRPATESEPAPQCSPSTPTSL